jgi:uncharacterized coiled-coil DUF342 family protein
MEKTKLQKEIAPKIDEKNKISNSLDKIKESIDNITSKTKELQSEYGQYCKIIKDKEVEIKNVSNIASEREKLLTQLKLDIEQLETLNKNFKKEYDCKEQE